jgi:hypothetical protein
MTLNKFLVLFQENFVDFQKKSYEIDDGEGIFPKRCIAIE